MRIENKCPGSSKQDQRNHKSVNWNHLVIEFAHLISCPRHLIWILIAISVRHNSSGVQLMNKEQSYNNLSVNLHRRNGEPQLDLLYPKSIWQQMKEVHSMGIRYQYFMTSPCERENRSGKLEAYRAL